MENSYGIRPKEFTFLSVNEIEMPIYDIAIYLQSSQDYNNIFVPLRRA